MTVIQFKHAAPAVVPPKSGKVTIINGDYIMPMAGHLKVADIQLYAVIHGEAKTKERFGFK